MTARAPAAEEVHEDVIDLAEGGKEASAPDQLGIDRLRAGRTRDPDDVGTAGEPVDDLPLAFVAPLAANDGHIRQNSASLLERRRRP